MTDLLCMLNHHYPMRFDNIEFAREGGSKSYLAFAGKQKYFLRSVKPAFMEAAIRGVDVQLFLQEQGFPVPKIVLTNDGAAYTQDDGLFILYEYIVGIEADPMRDGQAVGALVGQLHQFMQKYPGQLIQRDRQYYIGNYVNILRERNYPEAEEFAAHGDALWQRVKDLPRGYCHGDLYRGNVLKTPEGKFYLLDFDTSCEGFPLYDAALFCNMTDYFKFKRGDFSKTRKAFEKFMPGYADFNVLFDLIAVYHFALQATIMELFGPGCVDHHFFDKQLDWLARWSNECK